MGYTFLLLLVLTLKLFRANADVLGYHYQHFCYIGYNKDMYVCLGHHVLMEVHVTQTVQQVSLMRPHTHVLVLPDTQVPTVALHRLQPHNNNQQLLLLYNKVQQQQSQQQQPYRRKQLLLTHLQLPM